MYNWPQHIKFQGRFGRCRIPIMTRAVLDVAVGHFSCMMGRFGQRNGPFWTMFLEIKIFGAVLAMGRFGDGPFWYRPHINVGRLKTYFQPLFLLV